MAAWVPVDVEAIASRWRALTPDEAAIAPAIVADAQDIVEDALISAGVTSAPTDERWMRAYTRVVASMVIRVLKNPDSLLTETVDDYTYRRDSAISAGALYLGGSELSDLIPIGARRRRGAFSITLS